MGEYTCLKFTGVLKKKYVDDIKNLKLDEYKLVWEDFAKKYPFAENYLKNDRSNFIPFGAISAYNERKVGCENRYNHIIWSSDYYETYYTWNFACDLKDYDNTIETFINEIANEICEEYIALAWFEYAEFPIIYRKEKNAEGTLSEPFKTAKDIGLFNRR